MSSPLYVRLTSEQAGRLDRAAAAVPAHKKDLIGGLVERYVDPDDSASLASLRELAGGKRVTVELGGDAPVVGHAEFRPYTPPEVLDAQQAAELLSVQESAIVDLAAKGELPGREIGGEWRFSRRALLDWLGGA
jgi:excisionase family DNA binding protein